MEDFKVGTLLGSSGIRKLRGAKPLALFTAIFTLPFGGINFSRGIVNNRTLGFQKDSAYEFFKNPRYKLANVPAGSGDGSGPVHGRADH